MPHDIRPRDTKGTRSVLVDHELSGVIVGQTLATATSPLLERRRISTRRGPSADETHRFA